MNLICYNDKYALFSDETQTYLLEVGSFATKERLDMKTKIGYLQYGTGIAALACQSKVRIYDFVYKRDVYDFESYLKIVKVCLLKNLLVVIANERILVHDLKSKTNQCYIPIEQGQLAFVSPDYYTLRMAYYTESHLLANREIWLNRVGTIEGVKYQLGAYSANADTIALALKNVLSLYHENELVKVYGFDVEILELVTLQDYFFVKLADGDIVGCNAHQQVHFLEREDILLDFWNHQYDTILFSDSRSLFEMGKGLVRRYALDRAQPIAYSESKTIKKNLQAEPNQP